MIRLVYGTGVQLGSENLSVRRVHTGGWTPRYYGKKGSILAVKGIAQEIFPKHP